MIHYQLRCEPHGHGFDGWFRSGEDFERQAERSLVSCPTCGSAAVTKALMRPAVSKGGAQGAASASPEAQPSGGMAGGLPAAEAAKVYAKLQALAREVRAKADYVGPGFAEEARRIHYGETQARRIYGEASREEVRALAEEGVPALPLPPLPEDGH